MLVRLLAFAPLVVLSLACCFLPPSDGTGGGSAPPPPAHPLFDALEDHLVLGVAYGESPEERSMAEAVLATLVAYDGVVVRVVPGVPRHVVALVRLDDDHAEGLAEMDDTERNAMLTQVATVLDVMGASADEIAIGIRGNVFYGARYRRRIGAVPEYDVGFAVSADEWIEQFLATPPPSPSPSPSPTPSLAPSPSPTPSLAPSPSPSPSP